VIATAAQAMTTARRLLDLAQNDQDTIRRLGRVSASALRIHRILMERPIATAGWLAAKTGLTQATVNKALRHLAALDIVREMTAQKRNRLFSYTGYIGILNEGVEDSD